MIKKFKRKLEDRMKGWTRKKLRTYEIFSFSIVICLGSCPICIPILGTENSKVMEVISAIPTSLYFLLLVIDVLLMLLFIVITAIISTEREATESKK